MPRASFKPQRFKSSYSRDPLLASDLFKAAEYRDITEFRYALQEMKCDPNSVDSSTNLSAFQFVLQTPNSSEYIKLCIIYGADSYKSGDGRFPIHYAVASLCYENLETFLKHYDRSKVNLMYKHQSCLHYLINRLSPRNINEVSNCIKLLLRYGCSPNMPDFNLKTPFGLLLLVESNLGIGSELVSHFMENYDIDYHTYGGISNTVLIKSKSILESTAQPIVVDFNFMIKLLNNREELNFSIYFKAFRDAYKGEDFDDNCLTFLEMAVSCGMKASAELLLDENVDVNKLPRTPKFSRPPAFIACSNGHFLILELLLKRSELRFDFFQENIADTLLHKACLNFSKISNDTFAVDYQKCFDMILNDDRCDVHAIDVNGCTALHYAVEYKNDKASLALLKKGAYVYQTNKSNRSPLDGMSIKTFRNFLDDCISFVPSTNTDENTFDDIMIDYNFLFSKPKIDLAHFKDIAVLKRIAVSEELRNSLSHPVLSSLLFLKWSKLRVLFYINLAICFFSLISLVGLSIIGEGEICSARPEYHCYNSDAVVTFFKYMSTISLIILTLREFFQYVLSYKSYSKQLMNWFEITLILVGWIMILVDLSDYRKYNQTPKVLRTLLVLGTSFEFFQVFGSLPLLSISTHMKILKQVTTTFIKCIALYSIVLVSFGLSFYIMLHPNHKDDDNGSKDFSSPLLAIARTMVMLTGELGVEDLNLNNNWKITLFMLFLFLGTIVLNNLLNGLAVSDTQKMKLESKIIDLLERIEVISDCESVVFENESSSVSYINGKSSWLIRRTNLYPFTIRNGKIRIKVSDSDVYSFEEGNLQECLDKDSLIPHLTPRINKMPQGIMQKIRDILAEREEQRVAESKEKSLRVEIKNIQDQLTYRMRINSEEIANLKKEVLSKLESLSKSEFHKVSM